MRLMFGKRDAHVHAGSFKILLEVKSGQMKSLALLDMIACVVCQSLAEFADTKHCRSFPFHLLSE